MLHHVHVVQSIYCTHWHMNDLETMHKWAWNAIEVRVNTFKGLSIECNAKWFKWRTLLWHASKVKISIKTNHIHLSHVMCNEGGSSEIVGACEKNIWLEDQVKGSGRLSGGGPQGGGGWMGRIEVAVNAEWPMKALHGSMDSLNY